MPPPRSHQQWAPRPSPLARVHHSRPISQDPSMGLVRDPQFWKRFSTAIHLTEAQQQQQTDLEKDAGARSARSATTSSYDSKHGDDWLAQQRREKRNCRILCASVTLGVAIVVITAVVVALYFTRRAK